MPNYRNVTLSVMSQWEMKQFPEFPHPDSVHCMYRGPGPETDGSARRRSAEPAGKVEPTYKVERAPSEVPLVSCYIPSVQGVRFFFKYVIEPPYPDGQFFYFKLFMNGRHICSWGVNPRTHPRGQVLRALFEAEGKWGAVEDKCNVLKHGEIESRPFLFAPKSEGISAANDGGLIEIRVFRAKGRRRKLPNVEKFRPQDQYGINLPTAGLVGKPQDTKFYDWVLVDPKHEPYATFLFNYRSWDHLQSLQLIPPLHPRTLLKPSNSFVLLAGHAGVHDIRKDNVMKEWDLSCEDGLSDTSQDSLSKKLLSSTLHDSGTFGEVKSISEYNDRQSEVLASDHPLKVERQNHAGSSLSDFSISQATLDEWLYDRPLPKLPKAKPSFDHSRRSSASSNAPSITPSLSSWLEHELNDPSPESTIEVAAAVPLLRSTSQITTSWYSDSFSTLGTDGDAQVSPSPSPSNKSDVRWSTEISTFSTGIIIQKSKHSSPPSKTRLYPTPAKSDGDDFLQACRSRISISPSESEWLSRQRIPSPVKRDTKHDEKVLPARPVAEEGTRVSEPAAFRRAGHKVSGENWNRNYDY